jgi:hypothetical protein
MFFEHMKAIFLQNEVEEPNETIETRAIYKPKKQYISTDDILTQFGITKNIYNNLLVII